MVASTKKNERLELAKAIQALSGKIDGLQQATQKVVDMNENTIKDLDLEIETRKKNFDDLKNDMKNYEKNERIRIDQELAEYKRNAAIDILKEFDDVPIDKDELDGLREELTELKADRKKELDDIIKDERKKADTGKNIALQNLELKHKADVAQLNAQVSQMTKEISSLNNMVDTYKGEITAQRELTRQIADSGRSAPITQTFGQKN